MSRGNPNQKKLVEQLKFWGYDVTVKHNQICIPGKEAMTITMAKEFIAEIHASTSQGRGEPI